MVKYCLRCRIHVFSSSEEPTTSILADVSQLKCIFKHVHATLGVSFIRHALDAWPCKSADGALLQIGLHTGFITFASRAQSSVTGPLCPSINQTSCALHPLVLVSVLRVTRRPASHPLPCHAALLHDLSSERSSICVVVVEYKVLGCGTTALTADLPAHSRPEVYIRSCRFRRHGMKSGLSAHLHCVLVLSRWGDRVVAIPSPRYQSLDSIFLSIRSAISKVHSSAYVPRSVALESIFSNSSHYGDLSH